MSLFWCPVNYILDFATWLLTNSSEIFHHFFFSSGFTVFVSFDFLWTVETDVKNVWMCYKIVRLSWFSSCWRTNRRHVDGRRGFIHDEDAALPDEGSGQTEELPLPDAEVFPSFCHNGVWTHRSRFTAPEDTWTTD